MMTKSLERLTNRPVSRSNSVRRKIIPSFEPLSESTESDSLEEQFKVDTIISNKPEKPASVNIDDMDDDIGDISSSSEIEIGNL